MLVSTIDSDPGCVTAQSPVGRMSEHDVRRHAQPSTAPQHRELLVHGCHGRTSHVWSTLAVNVEAVLYSKNCPAGTVERDIVHVAPFSREHSAAPVDEVKELVNDSAGHNVHVL